LQQNQTTIAQNISLIGVYKDKSISKTFSIESYTVPTFTYTLSLDIINGSLTQTNNTIDINASFNQTPSETDDIT
jgi:hypothetical protein